MIQLTNDDPETLLHLLYNATQREKEAKERREALQEMVVELLRSEQHKSKTVDSDFDPTKRLRAVYVANRRVKVANEAGLKKAIGAAAFKKVCEQKVSMSLLDAAITTGTLDAMIVQQYLEATEAPNVRLYVVEKRDDVQI